MYLPSFHVRSMYSFQICTTFTHIIYSVDRYHLLYIWIQPDEIVLPIKCLLKDYLFGGSRFIDVIEFNVKES